MTKPVHVIDEFWPVKVAIFANEGGDSGRTFYSAVPSVSYKAADGWRDGSSFSEGNGDSFRLEKAMHAANVWISSQKKRDHESSRGSGPVSGPRGHATG